MIGFAKLMCFLAFTSHGTLPPYCDAGNTGGGSGGGTDTAPTITLSVSAHSENTLMAIADVTLSEAGTIAIELSSDATGARTINYPGSSTGHEETVVGMRAETTYTLTAVAELDSGETITSDSVDFTTGALPGGAPGVTLAASSGDSAGGITLFGNGVGQRSSPDDPLYWGVDEEGQIVWYLHGTSVSHVDPVIRGLDDGSLMVILDDEARIITPAGETLASYDLSVLPNFHHDAILMPNGDIMALSQSRETVNGNAVWTDTIYEIDSDGNTVWEWAAADHLDTSRFPGDLSTNVTRGGMDWTHSNAVVYLEDEDAVLLSSRSQSWMVKIDHASGDILWIAGDNTDTSADFTANFFTLQSGTWQANQHAPMIDSVGHLVVYDNRNESGGSTSNSRAVAFALDEDTMTAQQQWEYIAPKYTNSLGDVDELADGHRLICAGGPSDNGNTTAYIIEISGGDDPTTAWEIMVNSTIYRAERVTWDDFVYSG